jgi:hypothetical protein
VEGSSPFARRRASKATELHLRTNVLQGVIASYEREYKELEDVWKQLDAKAQGTITVCGVLLAGIFAFAREPVGAHLDQMILRASVVLIVISIGFALNALQVRSVLGAPVGEEHEKLAFDLLDLRDWAKAERQENFLRDQAAQWRNSNNSVHAANQQKAGRVQWAQWVLVGAVVCTASVTLLAIVE